MAAPVEPYDQWRTREHHCAHDLAKGVLVKDLRSGDGPEKPFKFTNPRRPVYNADRRVI